MAIKKRLNREKQEHVNLKDVSSRQCQALKASECALRKYVRMITHYNDDSLSTSVITVI